MKRLSIIGLLLAICLCTGVNAQDYVGLPAKDAQQRLQKETRRHRQPKYSLLPLAGTTKTFMGVVSSAVELQLHCDSSGFCTAEQYICTDEASAMQSLQKILSKKVFGWQPLNANQHVSKMEQQRLLEIYKMDDFWVVQVLLTNWSPLQYQLLFSNSVNTER